MSVVSGYEPAHWSVAGQPLPFVNGQHTQTHLLPLVTSTVVLSVSVVPLPLVVPGSPEPVSADVSCHGAGPISNWLVAGVAAESTVPLATQTVSEASMEGVPPATVTEHHFR